MDGLLVNKGLFQHRAYGRVGARTLMILSDDGVEAGILMFRSLAFHSKPSWFRGSQTHRVEHHKCKTHKP